MGKELPGPSASVSKVPEGLLLEQCLQVFRLSTEIIAMEDHPEQIPTRLVEALVDELDFPMATLVLEDPFTGRLEYAAEKGVPDAVRVLGFREGGLSRKAFRSGESQFVEDVDHDPEVNPEARPFLHAFACLPIHFRERSFGLLFVNYREPHLFSPVERAILKNLADLVAVTLDNARLRCQEHQRGAMQAIRAMANTPVPLTGLAQAIQASLGSEAPQTSGSTGLKSK